MELFTLQHLHLFFSTSTSQSPSSTYYSPPFKQLLLFNSLSLLGLLQSTAAPFLALQRLLGRCHISHRRQQISLTYTGLSHLPPQLSSCWRHGQRSPGRSCSSARLSHHYLGAASPPSRASSGRSVRRLHNFSIHHHLSRACCSWA